MSKEKVSLTPDAISDKWGRRMKAAIPDIQAGIEKVSVNPMEKAISKKDKLKQNLIAAIDDGTWEKQMGKVSLTDWKTKTSKKVAERMGSGVDAGMSKRKAFDTWLVSRQNEILPRIAAMPDMTLEDSISRSRAMIEHMASQKYKNQ